jgi:hypothetical protein
MSLEKNISDVLTLQDVELANAITGLKGEPAKLADFVRQQKASLYNTVTKEHSDNYAKVYGDLIRAGDTVKNITYYHVRNKDLDNTQQAIFDKARSEADAATYDSQIAKRQFEINEWTVGNKMDTLFVMQMLFIGLTLTAPLLYLSRLGYMPMSVFSTISFLILVAIILTFVVRYQYTSNSRDLRFWNRKRFAKMGGPPTPPTCEAIQGLAENLMQTGSEMASSPQNYMSDMVSNIGSQLA